MVLNENELNPADSDKWLLEGLKSQDKACIEQIYRDNFSMVQSLIINNNGSHEDALDIFQEAMIIVYEKTLFSNDILPKSKCLKMENIVFFRNCTTCVFGKSQTI